VQESGLTQEVRAVQAFQGTPVGKCDDRELRKTLVYTFALVGLTNYPDEAQQLILLQFIRSNFAVFTLEEIRLAFDMLAKGEIEADGHYQQYSAIYFSGVMAAYKRWAVELRKQIEVKQPQPPITFTENHWRAEIQKAYESFSEKTNYRLWPVEIYDQLVLDGFIQLRFHERFIDKARQILCGEVHRKIVVENDEVKIKSLENLLGEYRNKYKEFEVFLLAKQMCVVELFEMGKTIDTKNLYAYEPK
jgi:hypothetical protein